MTNVSALSGLSETKNQDRHLWHQKTGPELSWFERQEGAGNFEASEKKQIEGSQVFVWAPHLRPLNSKKWQKMVRM